MLSHDLQRKGLGLWRGDDTFGSKAAAATGVHCGNGLVVAQAPAASQILRACCVGLWRLVAVLMAVREWVILCRVPEHAVRLISWMRVLC